MITMASSFCPKQLQAYMQAMETALMHVVNVGLDREAYWLIEKALQINLEKCEENACTNSDCMQRYVSSIH